MVAIEDQAYQESIKAITVWQPWATLIALGVKRFETRGWATKYRGSIAIHAGKRIDIDSFRNLTINRVLRKHGILSVDDLPTGEVIAIANLKGCHPISLCGDSFASTIDDAGEITHIYENEEFEFGYYAEGRYAWEMTNVRQITPVQAKGQQGLWTWKGAII